VQKTFDLSTQLEIIRAKYGLPSLSAAAILNDQIVDVAAVGLRAVGKPQQVTLDDAYQLGSLSKSFTATMIARLVEHGILRFDMTLAEIMPELAMRPEYKTVNLELLLTHRSGITANVAAPSGELHQARKTYLVNALKQPRGPQKFAYSNVGYVAASMIAEIATGKTWDELVHQEIFVPLEMQGCKFGFGTTSDPAPHRWKKPLWGNFRAVALPHDSVNSKVMNGADGILCPLTALAKYILAHLQQSSFLKPETWKYLHHDPFGTEYAFGWGLASRPNRSPGLILTHSGSNTLNYAVIWIMPGKNVAMIAATNIGCNFWRSLNRTENAANEAIVMVFEELSKLMS
jgi:CubicO group peptidase (beta-lactamase class C family)